MGDRSMVGLKVDDDNGPVRERWGVVVGSSVWANALPTGLVRLTEMVSAIWSNDRPFCLRSLHN